MPICAKPLQLIKRQVADDMECRSRVAGTDPYYDPWRSWESTQSSTPGSFATGLVTTSPLKQWVVGREFRLRNQ